jgi:hypothetical protein
VYEYCDVCGDRILRDTHRASSGAMVAAEWLGVVARQNRRPRSALFPNAEIWCTRSVSYVAMVGSRSSAAVC